MADLQSADRVFHSGGCAVLKPVRLMGRNKVGDIAVNEEFALIRAKDRCDMDPAIAAGNDHGARALPFVGKPFVPALVLFKGRGLPTMKPLDQIFGKRARMFHMSMSFGSAIGTNLPNIYEKFEAQNAQGSTFWEGACHITVRMMKNVLHTPDFAPIAFAVTVLECPSPLIFDRDVLAELFARMDRVEAEDTVCRVLENLAERINDLQDARWRAAFGEIEDPANRIGVIADQIGLTEVAIAAWHVGSAAAQSDGIAMEATMARLERALDRAVTQVWNYHKLL